MLRVPGWFGGGDFGDCGCYNIDSGIYGGFALFLGVWISFAGCDCGLFDGFAIRCWFVWGYLGLSAFALVIWWCRRRPVGLWCDADFRVLT